MRQSRWPRRGKQWVIAVTVALLGTATGCATSTQNQLAADSMVERRVDGLKVTPFSLPDGCLGGYYPEMNPLMPLWRHDERSKTPAAKAVPVRILPAGE